MATPITVANQPILFTVFSVIVFCVSSVSPLRDTDVFYAESRDGDSAGTKILCSSKILLTPHFRLYPYETDFVVQDIAKDPIRFFLYEDFYFVVRRAVSEALYSRNLRNGMRFGNSFGKVFNGTIQVFAANVVPISEK